MATTRYGNRYKSRPTCWKTFLKILITCNASISCLTSSPTWRKKWLMNIDLDYIAIISTEIITLKMAACHTSEGEGLRHFSPFSGESPLAWESDTFRAISSSSLIPHLRTLNRAKYGALAALENSKRDLKRYFKTCRPYDKLFNVPLHRCTAFVIDINNNSFGIGW